MEYIKPELELIRFEYRDILTKSEELPFVPASEEGKPDSF